MTGLFSDLNTAVIDAFGETVAIRRDGQPDLTVQAVFDSRHYQVDTTDNGAPVSSLITILSVADADTGPIRRGDRILARSASYRVKDVRPDGQGMTALDLEILG